MRRSIKTRDLFVSHDSERLSRTEAWLSQVQGEKVLIARTRSAADDLAYRLTQNRKGILGLHRFTLSQIASALAAVPLAAERRVSLTQLGFEALVARAIFLTRTSQDLEYFGPVAEGPGFVRAVSSVAREIRAEKVLRGGLESIGPAGRDLARILLTLELELDKQSLADYALLMKTAIQQAGERGDRLIGCPLVLLDPRPQNALERGLIESLIDSAPLSCVTAMASDEQTIDWLERVLGVDATCLPEDASRNDTQLERIRRYLFLAEIPNRKVQDDTFELISGPGEGRETIEIARRILKLARQGTRFDQIAVLLRNQHLYQPQIEDAFERAQIPAYFSRGVRRPDTAGRAFIALLECALEDYSASRFAEYLSMSQVPRLNELGQAPSREVPWVPSSNEEQLTFKSFEAMERREATFEKSAEREVAGNLRTPLHWEKLIVDASVIGGYDRWASRLEGLESELQAKLESSSESDPERIFYEKQLERLNILSNFALPLIERLSEFPKETDWSAWLTLLQQLASDSLRNPDSVLSVLVDLRPMGKVGPVRLREVLDVLYDRLLFLRSEPTDHRFGRVFVGLLEEGTSRQFDAVFVPGLAEGIFPRRIYEDPLLQDKLRRDLALPRTRETRSNNERHLLRIAASAARRKLIVSYPRMDLRQGRARVPSLYALEIVRAASGDLPDLLELQRQGNRMERRLGWPAPRRKEESIDISEFDLAWLEPFIYGKDQSMQGGALYLMKANPWLARSVRSRFKRWESFWSDDDGLVAGKDPSVQPFLEKHRFGNRSYSPTALQHFAACPYRFFLYAILRLQPRQKIESLEKMDPLVRGSLIHEIQFEFFNSLQEETLPDISRLSIGRLLEVLDEVIIGVSERYVEDLVPAIPQVWSGEIEELRVDLRSWIREEYEENKVWAPFRWELSFGLPLEKNRDSHSTQNEVVLFSKMRFRGSVDLVEINRAEETLRVIDHKTGKAPRPRPVSVGGGEVLQPLLYALVAEQLLEEGVSEGQLYYCTRRGGFERHRFPVTEASRSRLESVLETIGSSIEDSFLPAAPRSEACTYCDYRLICGPYEELRVRRKHSSPLKKLQRIRELP